MRIFFAAAAGWLLWITTSGMLILSARAEDVPTPQAAPQQNAQEPAPPAQPDTPPAPQAAPQQNAQEPAPPAQPDTPPAPQAAPQQNAQEPAPPAQPDTPPAPQAAPQQNAQEPAPPAPQEEKTEDIAPKIWRETSLDSKEELQLTEKHVQQILEELKKTDPQRAEQLAALRQSDPPKFIDAIRQEIRKHTPSEKPDAKPQEEQPQWKEQLEKKHELFLVWLEKGSPEDFKELVQLRDSSPEKYAQQILDLMKTYEPIQRAERYSPKLAEAMKQELELQKQQNETLLQIRLAAPEQRQKLIEELNRLISIQFDTIVLEKQLRCELLHNRLQALTKELETQAAELDALKNYKSQAVENRIKELVERNEKVNWD
ncbi:MAG: hypothetical protein L0Y36_06115 [Planctomycetales bacterium]|nr:hypothetical protein [Planctomycetales bacterium]